MSTAERELVRRFELVEEVKSQLRTGGRHFAAQQAAVGLDASERVMLVIDHEASESEALLEVCADADRFTSPPGVTQTVVFPRVEVVRRFAREHGWTKEAIRMLEGSTPGRMRAMVVLPSEINWDVFKIPRLPKGGLN